MLPRAFLSGSPLLNVRTAGTGSEGTRTSSGTLNLAHLKARIMLVTQRRLAMGLPEPTDEFRSWTFDLRPFIQLEGGGGICPWLVRVSSPVWTAWYKPLRKL